jgi:quinoprotein glucose dehydrogenase
MKDKQGIRAGSIFLGLGIVLAGCVASQQSADAGVGASMPVAVAAVATTADPPPHPAVIASEEISPLPEGPGRETTIRVCSGCHAVELVTEKRLTRQEWFDLVQFMGDRGATGTPAEMAEITDYLAKAFPKE